MPFTLTRYRCGHHVLENPSEALETSSPLIQNESSEQLEQRVEQLNAAIADVRKQLEDLGGQD